MKIFEKNEIRDIIVALIALTIIFSYPHAFSRVDLILLYLIAVIIGFLFHELAHKFTAKKFGCHAQFKVWPFGLVLGLLTAIITFGRFKFAAPGAVVIFPFRFGRWGYRAVRLTLKESGIISAAGPAVNIAFALLFTLIPLTYADFLSLINSWLAFFNLLPVPPLDGSKIVAWKPWLWFLMILIAFLLLLPYFL
ncbi:MAG: site-2 protease family protein [Candidatus Aenigmatarchaeota archaeon]